MGAVLAVPAMTGASMAAPVRTLDLRDLGAPVFTRFGPYNGLPDTVVVALRTDRDGFTWAASNLGLSRYDGLRWSAPADPALGHPVDDLFVDHQGTLWAAFRNHGLAAYDGTRWRVENAATGLPSLQIRRFAQTRDAAGRWTLWALTWDHGLLRRGEDGRWAADPDNAGLPRSPVLSMAQTTGLGGQSRQWVGTNFEGIWYRDQDGSGWHHWSAPGFDPTEVEYLLATGSGRDEALWVSVFGGGLARIDASGVHRWSRENGQLPTDELYGMVAHRLQDGSQALWIATRSGLLRMHGQQIQVFDTRHGLPSSSVRGVQLWTTPDGRPVLWVATEQGVARALLDTSPWTTASLMGAGSTGVFGVQVEPDHRGGERLWVASASDGLGLYEYGHWQSFTPANSAMPSNGLRLIEPISREGTTSTYWVGFWTGDLMRMRHRDGDGVSFEAVATPWHKHGGNAVLDVLARTRDGQPELWVALRQGGIWRLRQGRWQPHSAVGVTGIWRIGRLLEQHQGGRDWLWAATDQGLARYDGSDWVLFGRDIGLPSVSFLDASLVHGPGGQAVLWLASTDSGIVRVDVGDPLHPRPVAGPPLPAPPIPFTYSASFDSQGRIYICTNAGVQQLVPHAGGGYDSRVFTRKDGLVHDECNANAQLVDAHDRYWTGMLGGLSVYDPHAGPADTQAKPLHILDVRTAGQSLPAGPVQLAAGARDLEVEYALLSWRREDESRFRTRLIGYEDTPGPWTTQRVRSFNALPPGHYRLRIEAQDYAGNASAPVQLGITVDGYWWQRWWARLCGVAALVLAGYGVALWRTRALRHRQSELETRVGERTAELNMANARLLELSYRDALTGLSNRRRLLETLEQDGAAPPLALVLFDVDHFKDYNDRFGHPAGDEALRMVARVLSQCAPEHALVARYGGEEFACLLPGDTLEAAIALADCCRRGVAACRLAVPGHALPQQITVSAGVAQASTPEALPRLLQAADLMLYQAKRSGRDQVCSIQAERAG